MALTKRFQDSSQRLINRFGTLRTYVRLVGEEYDVETQTMTATEELHEVKVFKTDPKEREMKHPNLVNKESAVMMIAASSLAFKPKVGDIVREAYMNETNNFRVETIKENWAGSEIVSWRLVCSQS